MMLFRTCGGLAIDSCNSCCSDASKKKETCSVLHSILIITMMYTQIPKGEREAITCMAESRIQAFLFGDVSRLVTPRNPLLAALQ